MFYDKSFATRKISIFIFISLTGKQMTYFTKHDTQCYRSPNINSVWYHKAVPVLQNGCLQYVLYHIERWTVPVLQYCCLQIDHKTVLVLQYCCLHYVLYQIDITVFPGLPEWLLHNAFLCSELSTICVISYWALDCSSSTVLLSTNWSYGCSWTTGMASS